ncbi:AAA family ATPase [Streptomyces enissocaesilis]|uniref:AAA family ATPase n=1 Tax=Streptomyces enissocaesilis TaxID=332589 RepID=A0ABN3WSV2_9ACTN
MRGAGKTTLVEELRRRLPDALVFDPERVGCLLRDIVEVPTGDFQDLPLWRRQVAGPAVDLLEAYGRPVLVPMTLVDPRYAAEIFAGLQDAGASVHHFFLEVSPQELAHRIDARGVAPDDPECSENARLWCRARIPECVAALGTLPPDTVLLDGELPSRKLADEVLAYVAGTGAAR